MANLVVTYDQEADAAYVYFADPQAGIKVSRTYCCDPVELKGMINLDFDENGLLLGVEVLAAGAQLPRHLLDAAERS